MMLTGELGNFPAIQYLVDQIRPPDTFCYLAALNVRYKGKPNASMTRTGTIEPVAETVALNFVCVKEGPFDKYRTCTTSIPARFKVRALIYSHANFTDHDGLIEAR